MSATTNSGTASSLPSGLPDPIIHLTTHNSSGKAEIHSSRKNDWQFFRKNTIGFNVIYTTSKFPPSLNDDEDIKSYEKTMASGTLGLVKKNGTVCRIVDFGPGHTPLMHRTQSLDYGIVLDGEVEMELDDGSTTVLKRGDIAVQRGTMHMWKNSSVTEWARMLFILQDCEPVVIDGKPLGEDLNHDAELPPSGE